MRARTNRYLFFSVVLHVSIVLILVLGFDFSSPMPVFENSNQLNVMSVVMLGDTQKSKILPDESSPSPPQKIVKKEPEPAPAPKPSIIENTKEKEEAIALEIEKKKLAQKKLEEKKMQEMIAKNLLADIKKLNAKQKKIKQKQLKSQFEKTLREQAEKSLRQQLLNEEIKLTGAEVKQSSGEVNKYQALILQAISERWLVPPQANKKLYCELMIRLAPGGMVLDVQVTKTSGDPTLDSSARAAVLKASPLPVPKDMEAFKPFKQFILKVKPENIMNQSLS